MGTGLVDAIFGGPGCSGSPQMGSVIGSEISFGANGVITAAGFFQFSGNVTGTLNFSGVEVDPSGFTTGGGSASATPPNALNEPGTDLGAFSGQAAGGGGIFSNDPLPEPLPTLVVDNLLLVGSSNAGPVGGPCAVDVTIISANYALVEEVVVPVVPEEGEEEEEVEEKPASESLAQQRTFEGSMRYLARFPVRGPWGGNSALDVGENSDGYQILPLIGSGRGLRVQGQSAGDMGPWPWGIWGSYQRLDYEDDFARTAFEADSDIFMLGADVSFWDNVVTGVAFGFDGTDIDIDTTFNAGESEVDTVMIIPYFGIYMSDYVGVDFDLSFDAKIGYGNVDIDQFRTNNAGTRVTSNVDADRLFFAGNLNASQSFGNWRLGGTAGWLVAREERDAFAESDGTRIASNKTEFGQLSVGGDLSYLWENWEPFARASYQFDYEREKTVVAGPVQPANDNDDVVFGAGLRWFSNGGLSAAFEWNTVLGREDFDSDTYMFFIRGDF